MLTWLLLVWSVAGAVQNTNSACSCFPRSLEGESGDAGALGVPRCVWLRGSGAGHTVSWVKVGLKTVSFLLVRVSNLLK